MNQEMTEKEIDLMIHQEVVGRLGCYAEGKIYVVPILYAFDGKYVYGCTQEGQKIQMMRTNPEVCFEIDAMQDIYNWRSVIAYGTFEELSTEQLPEALDLLQTRTMPFLESIQESMRVVYRILLTSKTGRYQNKPTGSLTKGKI